MAILGGLLGGIGGMGQDWWKRLGGGAQSLVPGLGPQDDEWTRAAMQAGGMQQEPMATRQGGGGLLGGIFNGGKVNFNDLGGRFAQAGAMMSGEWDSAANIAQNRAQLQGLRAKQMAEAQQQQQMLAALKAQGLTDEQAMLVLGNAGSINDFREKPAAPYRFEDNAGNVWEHDATTGENKRIFTDMAPKQYSYNGMIVDVPNPFAGAPTAPVGKLTPLNNGGPSQPATGGFRRYRR